MTIKEIYDDLMNGVPFTRLRGTLNVFLVVVSVGTEKVLAYRMGGSTYTTLGVEDLTATDWERA